VSDIKIPPLKVPDADFQLADLLNLLERDIFLGLNCHHIGIIQSFDSSNQTVTATMAYPQTQVVFDEQTSKYKNNFINYPLVVSCPAVILSGGAGFLNMPIAQGDECLLLFNDRAIDTWFASGQVAPLPSTRLHSFADAIALVGLRSLKRALTTYDPDRAVLTDGTMQVGVNPQTGLARIGTQDGSNTLKTLLTTLTNDLITAFGAATPTAGNPLNPAAVTALTSLLTTITGLLE